jgi:protocadherin-16/23
VSAVRSDGRRQRVTYSFGSGNEENTFEINSNNGLIRVRDQKRLDFESAPHLRLIVVAQAEGASPLYGYATVWVDLLDQNDNAPRFTQDSYTSAVWEGNNKGTFVMQVRHLSCVRLSVKFIDLNHIFVVGVGDGWRYGRQCEHHLPHCGRQP